MSHAPTIHPGEILRDEFLIPKGLTDAALAEQMGAAPGVVSDLVDGKIAVTVDLAVALGRVLGTTAGFWLRLQAFYEQDVG